MCITEPIIINEIQAFITEPIITREIQVFASQNKLLLRKYKVWLPKTFKFIGKTKINQNKTKTTLQLIDKKKTFRKMDPPAPPYCETFFLFYQWIIIFLKFFFGLFWFYQWIVRFSVVKPCNSLVLIGSVMQKLVFP